ncbi:MAG: AAA family ATPase [Raineya sp.]|nr:AAA family ATPase [Raineya sp.]MDW8296383.1 AAA family ATPase [Raineya sp.]
MDYVLIEGYKSIRTQKIEIRPINLLIGANGAGKSNFLSFFEFAKHIVNENLQKYIALNGGVEKILHKGTKITQSLHFQMEFENSTNGYAVSLLLGDEGLIFEKEYLMYQSKKDVDIASFSLESNLKKSDNFRKKYVEKYLQSFQKYHFHDTGRNSPFNHTSHIENDIYRLYPKGENLAAFLYYLKEKHNKHFNFILATIRSIAPYFLDFYLEPNSEGFIRLQWLNRYNDNIYGATDLSDGTIRFIALATLFLQPQPPQTIIIDEPELGLHPFAIAKLAGMIQSVTKKGVQVIAATQSADLISYFEPSDILTTDLRNGESIFQRLNENELQEWLQEYNLGELWKRNIIPQAQPFE